MVTDEGELDYLIRDTRQSGALVGAPMRCPLDHILTYYDGSQPQYTHLRASMFAYVHINLLSMLTRFTPKEVPRVAVDGIYSGKLHSVNSRETKLTWLPMKIQSRLKQLPRPGGVTRVNSCTFPQNTQHTSPNPSTWAMSQTCLAQLQRATMTQWSATSWVI